jgi:3-phenylpropionate/trans-cinnamate dioxygenase ferredoxin subunit
MVPRSRVVWNPENGVLDDVLVLSGAGVGGGSHVYGNTLYVPPKKFFDAPGWAGITDWADVPYYLRDRKSRVAIARVNDRLYAFDDLCTCSDAACPLSGGLLNGTTIMCQCQGSRFDVTSGAVINGPATKALTVYEVQEDEGTFRIRA